MPRKIVSEKTLELNICAEILFSIRRISGCEKAFWIGMKQNQEASNGIDELISNIPSGMHLAFQFKAPSSTSPDSMPYKFTINDRQNENLLRLSSRKPDAVFYIFPHYNTFKRMRIFSPNLTNEAYALKVEDLRSLPMSTRRGGIHTVETSPPRATIHSEPFTVNIKKISIVLENTLSGHNNTLVDREELKEWLLEMKRESQGNNYIIGQRLRGFSTLFIPR